jgi:hypothetical protein
MALPASGPDLLIGSYDTLDELAEKRAANFSRQPQLTKRLMRMFITMPSARKVKMMDEPP